MFTRRLTREQSAKLFRPFPVLKTPVTKAAKAAQISDKPCLFGHASGCAVNNWPPSTRGECDCEPDEAA